MSSRTYSPDCHQQCAIPAGLDLNNFGCIRHISLISKPSASVCGKSNSELVKPNSYFDSSGSLSCFSLSRLFQYNFKIVSVTISERQCKAMQCKYATACRLWKAACLLTCEIFPENCGYTWACRILRGWANAIFCTNMQFLYKILLFMFMQTT